MVLHIHTPTPPLANFVSVMIYYAGFETDHTMDRFLPDGNTELIISLNDEPQFIYENETLKEVQTCRSAWVSGVRTRPITIPSGIGSRMLIVAFKKGGAYPFYPMPMGEIKNLVTEAGLVWGRCVDDLRDAILNAPSSEQMFASVESFLMRQAGDALAPDCVSACMSYALDALTTSPSQLTLKELSEQIGYSQKHMIHLFKERVGVTPKQFMQIMRFQKTIHAMEQSTVVDWSEIALQNGFYDQAHFINEFGNFSGFTPVEYMKRKSDLLNYVPVR